MLSAIATDKSGIHIKFFLFLHETICCGHSLEVSIKKSAKYHYFSVDKSALVPSKTIRVWSERAARADFKKS